MYYYIPKPDFKIIEGGDSQDFQEPWVEVYPDDKGRAFDYSVKYKDTTLYNFRFILCDGGCGISILPNQKVKYEGDGHQLPFNRYYYIVKDSFQDKLNNLIQSKHFSSLTYQINYFKSEKEAEKEIEKSFSSEAETLICFRIEQKGGNYQLINGV